MTEREGRPRSPIDVGGVLATTIVAVGLVILALTPTPPAGLSPGTLGRWGALLLLMAAALWIEAGGVTPDRVTGPGISIGVILQTALPDGRPETGFWGIVAAYLMSALLATAWRISTGRDPLGSEAWKRAAMMGAFLGWFGATLAFVVAFILGVTLGPGPKGAPSRAGVPLGLALSLGAIVVMWLSTTGVIGRLP